MRTLILAGLGAAVWLAGCTTTNDTIVDVRSAAADVNCAPRTASRIERRDGDCSIGSVRTYTQDDLRRTGAFSTAEALQRLDPSITMGR